MDATNPKCVYGLLHPLHFGLAARRARFRGEKFVLVAVRKVHAGPSTSETMHDKRNLGPGVGQGRPHVASAGGRRQCPSTSRPVPTHKMKSKTLTDIVRCYVAKLPLNEPGIYYDVVAADLANACAAAYEAGRTPGAQPLSQGSLARLRREAVAALENCPK